VMTSRHNDTSLDYVKGMPGPGAYNPTVHPVKDKAVTVAIGKSIR